MIKFKLWHLLIPNFLLYMFYFKNINNRKSLYEKMSQHPSITGLCDKFILVMQSSSVDLSTIISSLPELKQACIEHPDFTGFSKGWWFQYLKIEELDYSIVITYRIEHLVDRTEILNNALQKIKQ